MGILLGGERSAHTQGIGFDLYILLVGLAVAEYCGDVEERAVGPTDEGLQGNFIKFVSTELPESKTARIGRHGLVDVKVPKWTQGVLKAMFDTTPANLQGRDVAAQDFWRLPVSHHWQAAVTSREIHSLRRKEAVLKCVQGMGPLWCGGYRIHWPRTTMFSVRIMRDVGQLSALAATGSRGVLRKSYSARRGLGESGRISVEIVDTPDRTGPPTRRKHRFRPKVQLSPFGDSLE